MNTATHYLSEAGWYPGRVIDIEYMLIDIEDAGQRAPNARIEQLFKEYWNLLLEFKTPDGQYTDIRLNIDPAIFMIEDEELKGCEWLAGEKLLPVGTIHDDSILLFVSGDENFYMLMCGKFYALGHGLLQALDVIIFQKDIMRIQAPKGD